MDNLESCNGLLLHRMGTCMKKYNKKQLKKIIRIQQEVIDDLRLGKKYLDDKNDQ